MDRRAIIGRGVLLRRDGVELLHGEPGFLALTGGGKALRQRRQCPGIVRAFLHGCP